MAPRDARNESAHAADGVYFGLMSGTSMDGVDGIAVRFEKWFGGIGQGPEKCVESDTPEPVRGIARVGLATVRDPVPVGRDLTLAAVLGLLGGFVAGVPEIVDLKQARGKRKAACFARLRQQLGPGGRLERGLQPGSFRGVLHERGRLVRALVPQARNGQCGNQPGGIQAKRGAHAGGALALPNQF